MSGYARLIITDTGIYVRFENVGRRRIFDQIMIRFNCAFLLKEWDDSFRAWRLPLSDLIQLVEFCKDIFGIHGYIIERKTIIPPITSQAF